MKALEVNKGNHNIYVNLVPLGILVFDLDYSIVTILVKILEIAAIMNVWLSLPVL